MSSVGGLEGAHQAAQLRGRWGLGGLGDVWTCFFLRICVHDLTFLAFDKGSAHRIISRPINILRVSPGVSRCTRFLGAPIVFQWGLLGATLEVSTELEFD